MAVRPVTRSPLLLLTLGICIALPSVAVSTHILSVFREEHASNPWWLPIWHAHFNTHGLIATITTCCIVFAVDVISMGLVLAGNKSGSKVSIYCYSRYTEVGLTGSKSKITKWTRVTLMTGATVAALIAMIMPAVANAKAPSKSDTIQTWTCHWKGAVGAPENFGSLCRESVSCYLLLSALASPFKARLLPDTPS